MKNNCEHILVNMEQWCGKERAYAIKSFYKNNDSYVAAQREFRLHFNLKRYDSVPSVKVIKIWITNFEETGPALKKKPVRQKTIRTPENVVAVQHKSTFVFSKDLSLSNLFCCIPYTESMVTSYNIYSSYHLWQMPIVHIF